MDGNGRRLGWIAIGIGVLALIVALGGRDRGPRWYGPGSHAPRAPFAQEWRGDGPFGSAGPRLEAQRDQAFRGPGPFGRGWFFFPFKIIGGLIQLALLVALVLLVLRLLGRGGGPQGGWRGGPPSSQDPPQNPPAQGSSDRPYTGETQNL